MSSSSEESSLSDIPKDDYQNVFEPLEHSEISAPNSLELYKIEIEDSSEDEGHEKVDPNELRGFKLVIVVVALLSAVFCVALDNTILATAIPRITDTFHTIDQVGWYGSAYFLTTCSFQILYARLYTMINVKILFLIFFFIFEVGSLVCGVAPSSTVLVVGRAIAGLGAAGIFNGASVAVSYVAPVKLRPIIMGMVGATFGLCAVISPLIGGAFTDSVSWRWCFYINLPIGAIVAAGTIPFLKVDQRLENASGTLIERIRKLDPVGNTLFIAAVICLLLAVQWGGSTYNWSNARIIVLFIIFGLCTIGFAATQYRRGDRATVPPHIASRRNVIFATIFAFTITSTVFVVLYYLPLWFQAVQGLSPIMSAIHTLPLIISQLLATFTAAGLTTKTGYYMPFVLASVVFLSIGTGLLSTFHVDESMAKWFGYQIILGVGIGFGFQQPSVAVQTTLPLQDVPIAVSLIFTGQFLGGTIFLSAGENIFNEHLQSNIEKLSIPGLNVERAVQAGATRLRDVIPGPCLHEVLVAYSDAVTRVFQLSVILACLSLLGALGMEWKNINAQKARRMA